MTTLRRKYCGYVILFCVLAGLTACEKKTSAPKAPATPAKKAAVTPKAAPVAQVATVVVPPPKFVYVAEGRRDPFQPFVLVKRPVETQGEMIPMTPLQQFDAQQYKLAAVIIGYGEPLAMVNAPDGKSYILRRGTRVGKNGGKVIRILVDQVQIEEVYRDLNDKVLTNIVEIKLPKREGV